LSDGSYATKDVLMAKTMERFPLRGIDLHSLMLAILLAVSAADRPAVVQTSSE
jgi:hypothetical protein